MQTPLHSRVPCHVASKARSLQSNHQALCQHVWSICCCCLMHVLAEGTRSPIFSWHDCDSVMRCSEETLPSSCHENIIRQHAFMSCCMQIATHQLPTLLHPTPFRLAAGLATCPVLHGHQLVCLLHIQQAAEIAIYEFRVLLPKCLLQGRMTTREYQGRKPSGQGCNREHGGNPATH